MYQVMDVTVSIISYNSRDLLKRCVKSIFQKFKGIKLEVIVVDNASSDGSPEMVKQDFPQVKLIKNKINRYYAANNQALKIAKGKYFLILNADTYFTDSSVKKMILFLEQNKNVGAVEGLELYENGKILKTGSKNSSPLIDFYELSILGGKIKNKPLISEYRYSNKNRRNDFEIEVGCDAFLMVRTKLMKKIGGYDEKLKLYYTENDLCLRIRKEGYKIYHLGSSKIIHYVSYSTNKLKWDKLTLFYNDLRYYYLKQNDSIKGNALYFLLSLELLALRVFRSNMFDA